MSWPEARAKLLPKLRDTQLEIVGEGPKGADLSIPDLRRLDRRRRRLLMEYAESVPFVPLSRCPICETVLEIRIDTVGIDAPWWWCDCPVDWGIPQACEHFRVFLGAIDFRGREPSEVNVWSVLAGPGAPFVIERMLEMEGMQAVISRVPLGSGDTGYLIAYFSAAPVEPADLHQEWRREKWIMPSPDGTALENMVNDPWQFELLPWLERGKLLWIAPDDPDLRLSEGTACPYRDLEGTRRSQLVEGGGIMLLAPPEGGGSGLYLPHDDEEAE
jgi:hypothetical protein